MPDSIGESGKPTIPDTIRENGDRNMPDATKEAGEPAVPSARRDECAYLLCLTLWGRAVNVLTMPYAVGTSSERTYYALRCGNER